jgi:hypothetical protein
MKINYTIKTTRNLYVSCNHEQWCSPGMLTRGALQKCPELAVRGGGVQYDILEIINCVGVYSNNCGTNIRHYSY